MVRVMMMSVSQSQLGVHLDRHYIIVEKKCKLGSRSVAHSLLVALITFLVFDFFVGLGNKQGRHSPNDCLGEFIVECRNKGDRV